MVTVGDGMDGVTQIPQQVPAVGDLDGIGRTLARAVGVDAGPVSGDDLDAGVGPQPRGQALGPPVRQQVDSPVALQVDQDRPLAVAATPGPFVHRQYPYRWPGFQRGARTPHHPQQRVGAGGHGQPRRGRRDVGEPFGEGHPWTGWLQASETPSPYVQPHRTSLPGQVVQDAIVLAVDPPGGCGAGRAGRPGLARRDEDGEVVGRGQDLLDQQPCRNERQEALGQERHFKGGEGSSYVLTPPRNDDPQHGNCGRT